MLLKKNCFRIVVFGWLRAPMSRSTKLKTTPQQGQLVFGRRSKKRVSQLFKKLSKGSKSFGSRD
jgi:hypothetical protein